METRTYIFCALAGFLGMFLHVFAVKIPQQQKRALAANIKFTVRDFFAEEWPGMMANVLTVGIGLLTIGELVTFKPNIQGWIITLFAFIGYSGSSVLLAVFGRIGGKINSVVDIKTNQADGIQNSAPTIDIKEVK